MVQLYPDDDARKHAQDSIQASLDQFEKKLWVPSREEVIAAREARERAESGDSTQVAEKNTVKDTKVRSTKRSTKRTSKKVKEPKQQKAKSSSSATRSVRNRRR